MPTTILIVEDEFLIAVEMEAVVHDLGHESAGIADDMESALAKASEAIDVALVDVNLADGATGPRIGRGSALPTCRDTDSTRGPAVVARRRTARLASGFRRSVAA